MSRLTLISVWSWLVIASIIEVIISYTMYSSEWYFRTAAEIVVALTAAVPLTLYYMGLLGEHISIKMFVFVALFFSIDLILIWTASLVH